MCATCGCSHTHDAGVAPHAHDHQHEHAHPHVSAASTESTSRRLIELERDVLDRNDRLATRNRGWLAGRGVFAVNLMSSPGAGKTTLLEATLREAGRPIALGVIEGDQATTRDADRIRQAGGRAVQINTDKTCHLDAVMVARALDELNPAPGTLVAIENVGNLVCPALFDLGEHARIVVMSVAEGDDKPVKYPHMFRAADLVVLNKVDLLPHVTFDVAAWRAMVREVNPQAEILEVSATRGDGLSAWCAWLGTAARSWIPQPAWAATTA